MKRRKPPIHLIDKFIRKWYLDEVSGELRDIGYTKEFLEEKFIRYFDNKYETKWDDLVNRFYQHQKTIKRFIARGIIVNPVNLRTDYEDDRIRWRDRAIPLLVQNGLYYIRYLKSEWTSLAKLENASIAGTKAVKKHLMNAFDEALHLADIGGKVKKDEQAKFKLGKIKEVQRLAYDLDIDEEV